MSSEAPSELTPWWKRRGPGIALVVLGFVAGTGVSALRSCGAVTPAQEHAGHDHDGASAADGSQGAEQVWTCSMHPQVRQSEPGQCPLCGMDLIPVDAALPGDAAGAPIVLSDRARALSRLRTTPVRRQRGAQGDIRLLGQVEANETTLKTVTAWTGGRIDKLRVNTTGSRVRAGQVIATLYSPEVFAAHQDLLVAQRQVDRMAAGAPSARSAAAAALDAARQRLRLLGVPDGELVKMETQESPTRAVPIRTPFGGTVIERIATEGAYVTTGAPLYRVADLRTLWIQLDAYESDLQRIAKGQQVRVEVEALPAEEFAGTITFIDPTLDAKRRTARVRVEVDNRDGRLRPGMFAQAVVAATTEKGVEPPLVVPTTAPLFTGRRAIVYVEVPSGDRTGYEPRTVRLGPRLGSFYPVVAGLAEGERVVSRGAFALDADLQIRGGASMMASPDDRQPGMWDDSIEVPRAELRHLSPIVAAYLSVQRALAADDLSLAQAAAVELGGALPTAGIARPAQAKAAWEEIATGLGTHARHVAQANSIEHARMGFEELSHGISMLLHRLGNPLDQPLVQAHCPMALGSEGASWVQQGKEIDNAYFGESMRSCGEIEHSVEPGAHLPAGGESTRAPPSPDHEGHAH